ncbi:hypothetical protein [Pseudoneobacillus sp. C159]
MGKRKKPKYSIGDKVVIINYGTIGEITDVKWIDGRFMYVINNDEGLFLEERLQLVAEYAGRIVDREHIDIEYQFVIGDIVQVDGYHTDLFKVVGFRTEIWRYQEDAWEDVIYELSRITDGEWLEASEEELSLVAEAKYANEFIQNLGYLYMNDQKKSTIKHPESNTTSGLTPIIISNELEEKQKFMVDQMLDVYNDYDCLYRMFKDTEYVKIQKGILRKLKRLLTQNNNDPH